MTQVLLGSYKELWLLCRERSFASAYMIIHFNIIILSQKTNWTDLWLALGWWWVAAGAAQPQLEPPLCELDMPLQHWD